MAPRPVSTVYEDIAGVLWVGGSDRYGVSTVGGLYRFNRASGSFIRFLHDPAIPQSLIGNEVRSIYQDRQGQLWVGTDEGLSRVDRMARLFALYPTSPADSNGLKGDFVRGMHLDRDDVLWVGTRDGVLNRYDRRRGIFTHYQHNEADPYSLQTGVIIAVHRDRQGRLWVGSRSGGNLSLLDEKTGRFTHYRHDPSDETSLAGNGVDVIYEDRDGVLWVGSEGLNRFDPATGAFTRYQHDPGDVSSISHNWVISIFEDHGGHLWVGTRGGGLNRFDRTTGAFTRYEHDENDPQSLNGDHVTGIYERTQDPGTLWVSLEGAGLDHLDVKTGRFTHYTSQRTDLPSNVINCLLGDEEDHLWLSTVAGITRFDPDTDTFEVFSSEDGLQMLEFDWLACHQGYNGELFFGGADGVNAIRPGDIFDNPYPPEVALTGLRLFNEPVVPGPDSPLKTSITETETLTLAHDKNDLTIEYVGLHFRHPERNQYAYMLDGYEDAWREVGTERRASYTNLPPGGYTFRVKASNSDGVWNEEGRSLAIMILPPWWKTWWAYLVYGLLFVVGLFVVDGFQRRRLIARERLRAEREKAKAIETTNSELQRALKHLTETQDQLIHTEKMASLGQLTAGIAHEIKNPLNFVNNFAQIASVQVEEIETILEKEKERLTTQSAHELKAVLDDLKINAGKINEHGQRADGIIRSMLEHSRADRGERRPIDLNKLVDEYANLAFHSWQAAHRSDTIHRVDPTLTRDYDNTIADVELYPQEIGRVLINLLDNAFYAVNERRLSVNGTYTPQVSVTTKQSDGQVEVHISDNGMGIPHSVRDSVFEPFFTTKPAGSGTGLGLSLSYDIVVKGHGGSLMVESEEGEGATFVVALPLGRGDTLYTS